MNDIFCTNTLFSATTDVDRTVTARTNIYNINTSLTVSNNAATDTHKLDDILLTKDDTSSASTKATGKS